MANRVSGQIVSDPVRVSGNWYLRVLDHNTTTIYRCISSNRYEVEHKGQGFEFKPRDIVQLTGELIQFGQFFFDDIQAATVETVSD
jgi:hypothetical protein